MEADQEIADLEKLMAVARRQNARATSRADRAGGTYDPVLGRFVRWDGRQPEKIGPAVVASAGLCDSPAEGAFLLAARGKIAGIIPQYRVGPFRVDFAVPARRVAIEIDGHDFHKTREQRTSDASRERWLQAAGWRVIRFTGSEVAADAERCVREALKIIGR